jgi:uncharacterized membrane protein YecN with MAPEG domain
VDNPHTTMGDRSHPQLQTIDRMKREGLTYTGWRADISKLEDYHVNCPILFDDHVLVMRKKQKIHLGDRSHPQLQTIDRLKRAGLTYNGWEKDVRRAERDHVNYPILFDDHVLAMRKKQKIHLGDRSHPQLQTIDRLKRAGLTYTGWEKDVRWAEGYHVKYPILFDDHVLAMRKKQKIHLGDRSHPQLQTIDRMKREGLTYTGWFASWKITM